MIWALLLKSLNTALGCVNTSTVNSTQYVLGDLPFRRGFYEWNILIEQSSSPVYRYNIGVCGFKKNYQGLVLEFDNYVYRAVKLQNFEAT